MRIDEVLKKAAGLLVELPEEQQKPAKPWSVMDDPTPSQPIPARQPESKLADLKPAPTTRTVEQVVREAPGPNLDEIKPTANPAEPVIDGSGNVNYAMIYVLANLPSSPFTAEQVLELLATLPADLPMESKRSTVKITINAMAKATGVTSDAIVADASRKLTALAAYSKSYADQVAQFTTKADAEITALLAEVDQRKRAIEDAKTKQAQMLDACAHETNRLDEVLEFFSLDIHPSKYAT